MNQLDTDGQSIEFIYLTRNAMYYISSLHLPNGKTASLHIVNPQFTQIRVGDLMDSFAQYVVSIRGLGRLELAGMGFESGNLALNQDDIKINQKDILHYHQHSGELKIEIFDSGVARINNVTTTLMPESGVQLSHLSAPQYGYDMVAATTQASINATMKEWLYNYQGEPFTKCYVYTPVASSDGTHYAEVDFQSLKEKLGFNPFDLDDKTPMSDEKIERLMQARFLCAFTAEIGLPEKMLAEKTPIIKLDKGSSSVSYNLSCKNFQLLNLTPPNLYEEGNWRNQSQGSSDNAWVFNFTVDIELRNSTSAFSSLPDAVKKTVKNLDPNSMFSVQQLYLDLNTARLESAPTISGIAPGSAAEKLVNDIFIKRYLHNLREGNKSPTNASGDFLLGYSVVPDQTKSHSFIVPSDVNFMISPYYDEQGKVTDNYDLYTLNWLVMTGANNMPASTPFTWNWLSSSEQNKSHGVMAIRRKTIADFLNTRFSQALSTVCIVPEVTLKGIPLGFSMAYSYYHDPVPQHFQYVEDGGKKLLNFSYEREASSVAPGAAKVSFKSSFTSEVFVSGNSIKIDSMITCYLNMHAFGGESQGELVKYFSRTTYRIDVDANGVIQAIAEPQTFSDQSKFDISGWTEFLTLGQIDDLVAKIRASWSILKTFLTSEQEQISAMLNKSGAWVFPGEKTFVFKDAQFSDFQDLAVRLTYAAPADSSILKTIA